DDQRVLAVVAEILAHRDAGVGGDVLQRRGITRGGGHHDRVRHRAMLFERLDHAGDGRALLADRDVDAIDVEAFLIDDRIHRDRGLAGLPVADDQLALAAADRNHRVDRLDPGLQRLADGLPLHDAGRADFDPAPLIRLNRPLSIERRADRIDHAAHERRTNRDLGDAAGALDRITFLDAGVLAHQHDADAVFLEVQRDAVQAARELQHLAGHRAFEPVDLRDAVADLDDRAALVHIDLLVEALDLFLDDGTDLFRFDLHAYSFAKAARMAVSRLRTELSYIMLPMLICKPDNNDG